MAHSRRAGLPRVPRGGRVLDPEPELAVDDAAVGQAAELDVDLYKAFTGSG